MKDLFSDGIWLILVALVLFATLPGCATIQAYADKIQAPEKAAKAVNRYCAEVPRDTRLRLREEVNKTAAPDSVQINCARDSQ